jgi:hypothetical protein
MLAMDVSGERNLHKAEGVGPAGTYMALRNDFIKCAIHCADVVRKERAGRKG